MSEASDGDESWRDDEDWDVALPVPELDVQGDAKYVCPSHTLDARQPEYPEMRIELYVCYERGEPWLELFTEHCRTHCIELRPEEQADRR